MRQRYCQRHHGLDYVILLRLLRQRVFILAPEVTVILAKIYVNNVTLSRQLADTSAQRSIHPAGSVIITY